MRSLGLLFATALACAQTMPWPTIPAAGAGLDVTGLEAWRANLAAHRTTGLIVIRRGRIALEWYAPEWNADRPHGTASMAKALVGGMSLAVAMSDGRISPDDLASKYIPGWSADPLKSKITIRQLRPILRAFPMRSRTTSRTISLPAGRAISGSDARPVLHRGAAGAGAVRARHRETRTAIPGMAALSYAITASLKGGDIRTLLKERVLDPLGVPERHWSIGYGRAYEVDGLKLYANWGGASFTARAAARVGQLMMLQGQVERARVDPRATW